MAFIHNNSTTLFQSTSSGHSPLLRYDLRTDGIGVKLLPEGALEAEVSRQNQDRPDYPFKNFSEAYVTKALSRGIDWRDYGWVTPAKDQGAHGFCGTFGRVASAEGQYARFYHTLRNFSEEELIDCIGWDRDQFSYFSVQGFMDSEQYPYDPTNYPDVDPPVPDHPCQYEATQVVPGTNNHFFTNKTGNAPNEDQLAAFVYKNGPIATGINADVFGLREKGCEQNNNCWITKEMCQDPSILNKPVDHSVTLVGFGTCPKHGDYWIVKNSWSTNFANEGFIYVQRGISCGGIDCCGNLFTVGDPAKYYNEEDDINVVGSSSSTELS